MLQSAISMGLQRLEMHNETDQQAGLCNKSSFNLEKMQWASCRYGF
jgi:ribosomal protein L37E